MKVLIIDDSNILENQLQQMLNSLEQVELVGDFHNGTDAQATMQRLNVGADYFISKSNGFEKIPEGITELRNN